MNVLRSRSASARVDDVADIPRRAADDRASARATIRARIVVGRATQRRAPASAASRHVRDGRRARARADDAVDTARDAARVDARVDARAAKESRGNRAGIQFRRRFDDAPRTRARRRSTRCGRGRRDDR